MRAMKVQASLRIRAVSSEPPLLAHTGSESIGTFRQKARSLAPLNGRACAVEICHDGMLEDTNSLDGAQLIIKGYSFYGASMKNMLWVLITYTHNICFYGELKKVILKLLTNTHLFCFKAFYVFSDTCIGESSTDVTQTEPIVSGVWDRDV